MIRILITGGCGFLGRNLAQHLAERRDCETRNFGVDDDFADLKEQALWADVIFHLAEVNRPQNGDEFLTPNSDLTTTLCNLLRNGGRHPRIVFSSFIQAELNNPYGISKAQAESALRQFSQDSGACVRIYRLKNLFGKWCRPSYNSVTATFCYNIANDLPISISDPNREIELSYVDDVVAAFLAEIDSLQGAGPGAVIPAYIISLGELAGRIQAFHEMKHTLTLPDFADRFNRALYATYLSHVPQAARQYGLDIKADARGSLAEFIKQEHFGQVFISRTMPGITRGNHYHHTKTEKFLVVEGEGLIRMRPVDGNSVTEYRVCGSEYRVVDIPPGLTHSITNVGERVMVTLFWSSAPFDPNHPDTYYLPVELEPECKPATLETA